MSVIFLRPYCFRIYIYICNICNLMQAYCFRFSFLFVTNCIYFGRQWYCSIRLRIDHLPKSGGHKKRYQFCSVFDSYDKFFTFKLAKVIRDKILSLLFYRTTYWYPRICSSSSIMSDVNSIPMHSFMLHVHQRAALPLCGSESVLYVLLVLDEKRRNTTKNLQRNV